MGVFSALGTIAFTFGDTLLPEIQARSIEFTVLAASNNIRCICSLLAAF